MQPKQFNINWTPILTLGLGLFVGGLVVAASGYNPVTTYRILFQGAFGSISGISQTLLQATPLLFCGLALHVSFQGGIFNIGVEGQLYIGALFATLIGISLKGIPAFIHIPLTVLAGMLGGAIWALAPAILKIKRGAHEVVTTIMFNWIATLFIDFLTNYPLKASGQMPQTEMIAKTAQLARLFPRSQVSWAILIGIGVAIFLHWFLRQTRIGYEITVSGKNPDAAQAGGVDANVNLLLVMILSGALAGMAGAMEVMGTYRRLIAGFSPGYGFDAIAVAVLGGNSLGTILSALLFGALRAGGIALNQSTRLSSQFIVVLQGIIILLVSAPSISAKLLRKIKKKKRREAGAY
jgi:ABC-type uncharacterized transport system permease subunit